MYSCLVCLSLLTPADPDAPARAALALGVTARPAPPSYESLRARAVAEHRPLVVWVGLRQPELERPGWLHYHCDAFPGAAPPCAVVGRPAGGELWRVADLPAAGLDARRLAAAGAPARFAAPARCGPGGCP
jgi:hypothetical protein